MKNSTPPNPARIAFVQSGWHADIVDQCRTGFMAQLKTRQIGLPVDVFQVPGAFEIPLKCKQLLKSGDYTMAVAAGFVVDGNIYRHEFVAQAVINALMQVQLEMELPVLSVVLTPKQMFEEKDHHAFFFEHMRTKGAEAADVVAQLIDQNAAGLKASA